MTPASTDRFFRPLRGPGWVRPLVFLGRMMRVEPGITALATISVAALGLVEGVGLGLLLPLLSLIGVGTGRQATGPSRAIERGFAALHIPLTLTGVLAVFLAVGLLQVALTAAQQYCTVTAGERLTVRLRRLLFDAASRARWTVLVAGRGGYLMNAVVGEAIRIGVIFGNSITAFGLLLNFAIYIGFAAWLSWRVTLVVSAAGALSMLALRALYRATRRFGAHTSAASNRMQEVLNEHVLAAKMIHAFGAGEWSRRTFAASVGAVGAYARRHGLNTVMVKASVEPLGLAVIVGMVYVSVAITHLPVAELMLLLLIFYRTMPRLVQLQEMLQRIYGVLPAYESAAKTLSRLEAAAEHSGTRRFDRLSDGIELRGVTVRHGDRDVLSQVDLRIPARSTVALLGASGGGKTTLLDVLAGVLPPQHGAILIDGVPLDELDLVQYRRRLAIVPQEIFLFHDTIAANLRFADPDASDEDLWAALRAAHAEEFVRARREGLGAVVGDQGLRLSGGQRQRLALARALLRRPDVLLLDEPSSALDPETEAVIRDTFRRLRGQVTIVLVSHRASLAEDADAVYAVADGRIRPAVAAGPLETP